MLRYGVAPELVPLRALGFRQLSRARARHLYDQGVRTVADLAGLRPEDVADPRLAPLAYVREWVERARQVHDAQAVAAADRGEDPAELDELTARFRIDPAALG